MTAQWVLLILFALSALAYVMIRARAIRSAGGNIRLLHSGLNYYGVNAALIVLVPSLLIFILWLLVQPIIISAQISVGLDRSAEAEGKSLVMPDVQRLADGLDQAVAQGVMTEQGIADFVAGQSDIRNQLGKIGVALGNEVSPEVLQAAKIYRGKTASGQFMMTVAVFVMALAGFCYALRTGHKDFRARNAVERTVRKILMGGALIAILTTVGIFLALIFNTVEFLRIYPWADYVFGTTWQPHSGGGTDQPLGLLPLLWGTLYISIIALIVAVPIGLFAAIYLAEYASPGMRTTLKPLLEILAGIPSIVYGLFALLIVGPILMSVFGREGLGIMEGASSVMTAGLVMGIMLIPFVSSLSDDIINAVPQALRDGSLGLGATQSETIRQVVLPAALPGIVGAVILAASRAIGETMLVVFGAGAAGRMSMNPFEAMTTVTAKIVSQLTGDSDFTQPEVLVAYALGTTLFVVTLLLNLLAQKFVRKYREQY